MKHKEIAELLKFLKVGRQSNFKQKQALSLQKRIFEHKNLK